MKKPLPEDFLLRPEIIAWCGTRQTAARKVVETLIKARKEADKKKSS